MKMTVNEYIPICNLDKGNMEVGMIFLKHHLNQSASDEQFLQIQCMAISSRGLKTGKLLSAFKAKTGRYIHTGDHLNTDPGEMTWETS